MKQAMGAYRHNTATPKFREIERLRSKARYDDAEATKHARLTGDRAVNEKRLTTAADKDAVIADKDALIAKLRERLGEDNK